MKKKPIKKLNAKIDFQNFNIVGIGASAGGLEALNEFFENMPAKCGLAFVVITHLHPDHTSHLPEILSQNSKMLVVAAEDGIKIEPDKVYVCPAGAIMSISKRTLHLVKQQLVEHNHLPIDYFFNSLASDIKERAICIILSGTGADGSKGMRAIKAEYGMAIVQEITSSKYTGMPASAIATGLADYILPPKDMGKQLIKYNKNSVLAVKTQINEESVINEKQLHKILNLIFAYTGHNFSAYKSNTIRRRIERQMNMHHIKNADVYIQYLKETPHEIERLFKELLINVTCFFRDPKSFDTLIEKVFPHLLKIRPDEYMFRIWVPGCSSGEEVYSIAILINEFKKKIKKPINVQIFGTDLDEESVKIARKGVFHKGIVADVPPEMLNKYFIKENNSYKICNDIRKMVIFAQQNVIMDPPYTKIDMISCRNLLIYFDLTLQRRLIPVFHYALKPEGILFLGPSESMNGFGDIFEPIDTKHKIFKRKETASFIHPMFQIPIEFRKKYPVQSINENQFEQMKQINNIERIEQLLLNQFAPPSVIVDENGNIVYICGHVGMYLEPASGHPRNNITEMAREGLSRPLIAAMHQALTEKGEVVRENIRVKTNGGYSYVTITVKKFSEPASIKGLLLITFQPYIESADGDINVVKKKTPKKISKAQPGQIEELEKELQYTKESLYHTIEEFETSNEELKSTNEELQSANEELQSSNEELETSKEELQSLNEELTTLNNELQSKFDELSLTQNDMQNLLNSTQSATIFLDNQLNIKRFTEQSKNLFNLIQTDIGRPLSDLTSNIKYNHLIEDCREVLKTLVLKEVEIQMQNGSWQIMRVLPYRTLENVIQGLLVTFVDINRLKKFEREKN